ncbi:MAG: ATP-binding cassette domain-containing protein [Bacteroidales bacterium]
MSTAAIQISDLTKRYRKDRSIEKINLRVEDGEIFVFIGPNGAGKSTTIHVLLNLLFPAGRGAHIMGLDTVRDTKKIRARTGYIPSEANPYPDMTAQEFVRYSALFYKVLQAEKKIREMMGFLIWSPGERYPTCHRETGRSCPSYRALFTVPGCLLSMNRRPDSTC